MKALKYWIKSASKILEMKIGHPNDQNQYGHGYTAKNQRDSR